MTKNRAKIKPGINRVNGLFQKVMLKTSPVIKNRLSETEFLFLFSFFFFFFLK